MRLRTAAVSAGIAIVAVAGLSTPAQAADWKVYGHYVTKSQCVDAGQQYVREGFNAYKCTERGIYPPWILSLK
ncbi:hypothetical protein NE236_14920 [Actinoallomurus purpureus]|uniref:hypothetical protein n=1 Tax=Actinoallomurus purpureus TaxID=478114 RepID=UPI002093DF68|nr:hypothetical protein [Actinoallomurus purpureus]MCO6006281.1 hypothetical protein [Actinoallomurus purpureus]